MPHRTLDIITTHPSALDIRVRDKAAFFGDLCDKKSCPPWVLPGLLHQEPALAESPSSGSIHMQLPLYN